MRGFFDVSLKNDIIKKKEVIELDAISIKTDYEVLKSLIKIKDLITYAKANNINSLGVIDNNLSSSIEFY